MDKTREPDMRKIKEALDSMGIPCKECKAPESQLELIKSFNYEALPIVVDLSHTDTVDAETGVVVQFGDPAVDNGVYIFTVLRSGQAGFIVVIPGTVSRAPIVRKVTGDVTNAINGIDFPPLMAFDMVEITAIALANTFMKMIMEACRVPKEYEQAFLHLYMPKFLANVGMYFIGATNKDGSPMVYEEIANMEPMMVWRSIQKGAVNNEGESTGGNNNRSTEGTGE